jgi:hypothetical protein
VFDNKSNSTSIKFDVEKNCVVVDDNIEIGTYEYAITFSGDNYLPLTINTRIVVGAATLTVKEAGDLNFKYGANKGNRTILIATDNKFGTTKTKISDATFTPTSGTIDANAGKTLT